MTDTSEVKPDNELKILVSGSPDKVTIKDRKGTEHILQPLDLSDIIEYEEKMGQSILDGARTLRMKDIAYLLYLSLRKEGLTLDDVVSRKYRMTERQIYTSFDLQFLARSATFLLDILRISGFEIKGEEKKADPLPGPN